MIQSGGFITIQSGGLITIQGVGLISVILKKCSYSTFEK